MKPTSSATMQQMMSSTSCGKTAVNNAVHRSANTTSSGRPNTAPAHRSTPAGTLRNANAYQRRPTRQRRQRDASSRTPSRPSVAATTMNAGSATPKIGPSES